ncbi:MAG: hypothetical protein DWQ37_13780 [Planctomycetota bacterium]|nr:MAG: hypothetical protein DWQ37_13780 [Planctomycetota bacterium]
MAREEQDREDLLAEATALVERVSFRLQGASEETVAGFRRDGSPSLYLRPTLVYQFNAAGELRRAHVGEALIKARQATLVTMRRRRTQDAVELVSRELDARETDEFVAAARRHLHDLHEALESSAFELVGQVPAEADVLARVRAWLAEHAETFVVAKTPRAG